MKKLLMTIALLGLAVPAFAQIPKFGSITLANQLVAGGVYSNGIGAVIDVSKQQVVAFSFTTGATNTTCYFGQSVDGSRYSTNLLVIAFTNALPSNNQLYTLTTNITVGGYQFLRLDAISVAGTIIGTNTISYANKISSP